LLVFLTLDDNWWAVANHIPVLKSLPDCEIVAVNRLGAAELVAVQKTFGIERGFDDATDVLALPEPYRRRLRTTNAVERLNEEIRRRERVIRIFPNEASLIRLGTALADNSVPGDKGKDGQKPPDAQKPPPKDAKAPEPPGYLVVDPVPYPQVTLFPPALRQTGFLALLAGVGETNLAGDREHLFVGEAGKERGQRVALHSHVAVEQHHNVVLRRPEPDVRSTPESEILLERDHSNLREILAEKLAAAVGRPVVNHDDFAIRRCLKRWKRKSCLSCI
jgi:hypothetical protein